MQPSLPHAISARQRLLAAGLVFLGAIFFSTKAILVKLAYRYGIDTVSLLALRMAFSLPLFLLAAWWSGRTAGAVKLSRRDWANIAFFGLCGYYLASLLDFWGLNYLSAGMERLILFVYPTLVLLLSAWWLRKPITRTQLGAVALTYAGIAVAFAEVARLDGSDEFWLGALLVFGSAFTYAVYLMGSGQLLPRLGTLRFNSYAMTAACLGVLTHHGIALQWRLWHFPMMVYVYAVLMALIATVLPSFMISDGIRRIGASNAAIIGSVGPISTILMAYVFLGESFGVGQWVGTVLVIGGVLVISLRK